MSFSIGIVGLPNVGKSTLFNALTRQSVVAENYPFATIDPNVGVVAVPDERLQKLAKLEHSKKIVPTVIEFIDIAGLVKDAHQGEGLGNQFLSHIREVNAIAEVVRFFEDTGIHHVEGGVNPARDTETIKTELILADLATLKNRLEAAGSQAKSGDKKIIAKMRILECLEKELSAGKFASEITFHKDEMPIASELQLLTAKPILLVANVSAKSAPLAQGASGAARGGYIPIDIKLEAELSQLSEADKKAYQAELGEAGLGIEKLILAAYKTLNLITFFTTGPDETRAWTVRAGAKAPEAAGKIHTDFERGFIKAEVINWEKLLAAGAWTKARDLGLIRTEGKEYVVQDGDVMVIKFNV